jgi:cell wall-associated NlpC family hydrolase
MVMYKDSPMGIPRLLALETAITKLFYLFLLPLCFVSCDEKVQQEQDAMIIDSLMHTAQHGIRDSIKQSAAPDTVAVVKSGDTAAVPSSASMINTGPTSPDELMRFAETLIGTPYAWASTDPKVGFDCSGFITYVFTHFKVRVPRSSVDFTNVGKTVSIGNAKRGDIILFTGTNSLEANIGHMGLVVSNGEQGLEFIHATSGKAMAVTITKLNEQYKKRFIRVSRIFNQNG